MFEGQAAYYFFTFLALINMLLMLFNLLPVGPLDGSYILPYLLPRNIQPRPKSRRNEPAYLTYVLETVAQARGQSVDHVADITTRNAIRFFGLDERRPG